MGGLRSCFARTQTWLQAGKYVTAVASGLPSLNGRAVAEHAGDRTPDRAQRLLNRASWDEMAAMSQVRKHVVAGLDEAARRNPRPGGMTAGALDETGQQKQGTATAGVKRQYMGCAGRVASGINRAAGRVLVPGHARRRDEDDLQGRGNHAAEGPGGPGDPLGGRRLQGRAVVRLGAAGHRIPAALPAHPPSPQDR
jgi:hypothetical protein